MASALEQTKRTRPNSGTDTDTTTMAEAAAEDRDERLREREDLTQRMVQHLDNVLPDLLTKTQFVPPVHVNKMALTDLQPSDLQPSDLQPSDLKPSDLKPSVLKPSDLKPFPAKFQDRTKKSDFRDDRAQLAVERVMWGLAEQRNNRDVMVVLSKFNLDHYLNKTLSGASVPKRKGKKGKKAKAMNPKARAFYPTPMAPDARGEVDLLIVHKDYGILIMEIKAIGDISVFGNDEAGSLEKQLGQTEIAQALEQLNKQQVQLQIITSDLSASQIPMTKIAAFPNVTRDKLREVMTDANYSSFLSDELPQYLGQDLELDNALKCWLCQDEIIGPVTSEGTADDVRMTWWEGVLERMASARTEGFQGIEADVYRQLVARLCGPLSTVEVWRYGKQDIHEARDQADAAHVMGTWCKRWILRKEQLEWYRSPEPFVYLTGPPGSGKTMLLEVRAVAKVRQGRTLVVVVRGPGNLPGHLISQLLHCQIRAALQDEESLKDRVLLETIYARTDPKDFLGRMKHKAEDLGATEVMFLVDELWLANPSGKILNLLNEMVEVLETCKKDAESDTPPPEAEPASGRASASSTLQDLTLAEADSSKPPGASPQQASARVSEAAQEGGVDSKILEALRDIGQKMQNIHTAHELAKSILTEEIVVQKMKLLSIVEEMQGALMGRADLSHQVLEKVRDVQFYGDVVTSWMTSPVLHEVMQEARRHTDVALWCTGFWANRCPQGYQLGRLPSSIRCPSYIQELLEQTELLASHQETKQYDYLHTSTQMNPPLPAEAAAHLMVNAVNHGLHVTFADNLSCVSCCVQCADELAKLLLESLHIGSESNLDFCDVLIVGRALLPIKPDSAFVRRLREREIPVSVVVSGSDDLPHDGLQANTVLLTNTYNGHGLERTVVVFVPDIRHCGRGGGGGRGGDGGCEGVGGGYMQTLGQFNKMGLWFIASRTLGKFFVFHV